MNIGILGVQLVSVNMLIKKLSVVVFTSCDENELLKIVKIRKQTFASVK